jgi:hypothetical protein
LTLIKKIRSVNADGRRRKTREKQQLNAIFRIDTLFLALTCETHTTTELPEIISRIKSLKK